MENFENTQDAQTIVVVREEPKNNGAGKTGLVLAILGLLFSWIPVVGWILWVLGLIFSIVGLFNPPRGKAVAGLIISFIDIIVLVALIGSLALLS